MSDNLSTNVQLDESQNGTVTFATEVVATIAGLAAAEVDGVASMVGGSGGLADILNRRGQGTRNLTKGVKVEVEDGKVAVHIAIIIDYGSPIPEVALNIQENVKKAIETMSGLVVTNVDVHVQGVSFDRENRATAEIEMQQRVLLQKSSEEEPSQPLDEQDKNEDESLNDDTVEQPSNDDEAEQDEQEGTVL